MIVVIPVHNQAHNMAPVLRAYLAQSKAPKHIVLVLDRCTDNSRDIAEHYISKFDAVGCTLHVIDKGIETPGFGAGSTRDAGIRYAIEQGLEGDFLFSDGDCVPSNGLVAHHGELLASELPRITCGLRYETIPQDQVADFPLAGEDMNGMRVQTDLRQHAPYCAGIVFGDNYDRLVIHPEVFKSSWICWSCNLGMNRAAIDLCHSVNGLMEGDEYRVFNSAFDGQWGGEDGFVGLTLFYCGGETVALSPRSWVTHLWHPRSHTNIEHMYVVKAKECALIGMALSGHIPNDPTVYRGMQVLGTSALDLTMLDNTAEVVPSRMQEKLLDTLGVIEPMERDIFCLVTASLPKFVGALPSRSYVGNRDQIEDMVAFLAMNMITREVAVQASGYTPAHAPLKETN